MKSEDRFLPDWHNMGYDAGESHSPFLLLTFLAHETRLLAYDLPLTHGM
jgi:hypothetical protein